MPISPFSDFVVLTIIVSELQQRFGRVPSLHFLIVRIYTTPAPRPHPRYSLVLDESEESGVVERIRQLNLNSIHPASLECTLQCSAVFNTPIVIAQSRTSESSELSEVKAFRSTRRSGEIETALRMSRGQ